MPIWLVISLLLGPRPVDAETGVTKDEILIGSCVDLNSPANERGKKRLAAAGAYFKYINSQGGVNGRKLKLISFDDSYDPEKAIECFRKLMDQGVFAGAFFVGSVPAAKYVDMAQRNRIPTVGFNAGAAFLYEPVRRYVFNTRASFKDAMREQIDALWKQAGVRKIGVMYQGDALGANILDGVRQALGRYKAVPVAVASFSREGDGIDEAVETVRAAKPEAVIMAGLGGNDARISLRARSKGWSPVFVFPTNDPTYLKLAGEAAEGTVMLQFVPSPSRTDLPSVALYSKLMAKNSPGIKPDFFGLESFMDAIVLVAGLRKAGPNLTRERFVDALESMHHFDIGLGPDFVVTYGANNHAAFDRIYYTYVRNGRVVDLKDWKSFLKNRKG